MPILPMRVYGCRCDSCGALVACRDTVHGTESELLAIGWRRRTGRAWACPACVAAQLDREITRALEA